MGYPGDPFSQKEFLEFPQLHLRSHFLGEAKRCQSFHLFDRTMSMTRMGQAAELGQDADLKILKYRYRMVQGNYWENDG